MSLAELLPAIRALMPEERQELKRILDAESPAVHNDPNLDVPEYVKEIIHPGAVFEVWSPTIVDTTAEDFEKVMKFCDEMKRTM